MLACFGLMRKTYSKAYTIWEIQKYDWESCFSIWLFILYINFSLMGSYIWIWSQYFLSIWISISCRLIKMFRNEFNELKKLLLIKINVKKKRVTLLHFVSALQVLNWLSSQSNLPSCAFYDFSHGLSSV